MFGESLESYREEKRSTTTNHTQRVLYSLFVYMSTLRGLFCGFHFLTVFCSLCHEVWEAIQKLQPCQGSGQCLQIKLELRSIMGSHSGVCVCACMCACASLVSFKKCFAQGKMNQKDLNKNIKSREDIEGL